VDNRGGGALPGSRAFPPRPVPGRLAAGRLAVRDEHAQGGHDPDVRRRPAKPVASAIGEGAIAISSCPSTCRRRTAAVIPDVGEEIIASQSSTLKSGTIDR